MELLVCFNPVFKKVVILRQLSVKCECSSESDIYFIYFVVGPTSVYIENVTPDNNILGIEGQDMTIKCTAIGGDPPLDVKLVILGSNYDGSGSAHHTFKPHSSGDGSTVTCQAGHDQNNFNPLSTSAYIHLMCKYIITLNTLL